MVPGVQPGGGVKLDNRESTADPNEGGGRYLDCAGKILDLSRPLVMGILNTTPDSFSDGGRFFDPALAFERAAEMAAQGADILDVGGESTRPGAPAVGEQEEIDRILPVIERISDAGLGVPVSVDTSKPAVMRAAVAAGASMINDVLALRAPGALETASVLSVPVCLMHMLGEPRTMQLAPAYGDVTREIRAFLSERIDACVAAGIPRERLLIDPGFGFGKNLDHNLRLMRDLGSFDTLGVPLLVGVSRKSMIGAILGGAPTDARLFGSLAAAVMAVERGAAIVRVHDVKPTVDAVRVVEAVRRCV